MAQTKNPRGKNGQFKSAPRNMEEQTGGQTPDVYPGGWGGPMQGVTQGFSGFGAAPWLGQGFGGTLWGSGGGFANPMGFPGYGRLYTGSYRTYRWMLQHPVLQLVRSICLGILYSSQWEYEKSDNSVPDDYVELVRKQMDPLRFQLLEDFLGYGRDFGWYGGELIWEYVDGTYVLSRVKPLLIDTTEVLQDNHGNFTGLRNQALLGNNYEPVEIAAPFKAWKFTYGGEAGYPYGRSWLENVRATAWAMWLDGAQQIQKLGAKISGMVTTVTAPAGWFNGPIDPSTNKPKMITYQEQAIKAIKALAEGAPGVYFPSINFTPDSKGGIDALRLMGELVSKSMVNLQVHDFGSQSPAITGILEKMKHAEILMFNGGLRSSRTGMEAEHGSKADAGEHTDTGTYNAEADDRRFAHACQPLVDAIVALNRRERPGAVRIKPTSLVDRKQAVMKAVLLAILNDRNVAWEAATSLDIDYLLKQVGLKIQKPFNTSNIEKIAAISAQPIPVPEPAKAITSSAKKPGGKQPNRDKKSPEPQGGRPTNT